MRIIKLFKPEQKRIYNSWRSFVLSAILVLIIILTNTLFTPIADSREKSFVTVGAYENKPKIFTDPDGNVAGFWPDLLSYIAHKEDWNIKYIHGSWGECLERLLNGQIDIMPDVAFTEERDKIYAFSKNPVLASWSRVYVKNENTDIESITDLGNKKLAVLKGSVNFLGADGIKEIVHKFNINCTFIEFDSYIHVFEAVKNNLADAGVTNRNFGNKNQKKFDLKKTAVIFQPINIKFAFTKNSLFTQNFSEKIDYHIKKLLKDNNSLYYRLLDKHFEIEIAEKTIEVFPMWLKTVLKSFGVLIFCLILVVFISRIQVKKKTRELTIRTNSLRESEENYKSIFENAVEGFFQSTPEGRFLNVNPAFANMLGYASPEELISSASDIAAQYYVNYEDRNRYKQVLQEKGIVKFFEFKARCKDGSHIWVSDSTRVIYDQDGKIIRYEGNVTDITHRKQAEEEKTQLEAQYRQAQKMESVGRLAGGVAHDYNNALGVIMGYTELAMTDADPAGPLYADLNEVLKAARRAKEITRQLLSFARKQTITPIVLNLNVNVESTLKMLLRLMGEDIDLAWLPETNLWSVKMDPSQIDQILANLSVNARDAIDGVGKVTIETANRVFDAAYCAEHKGFVPGQFVMLAVSDNGCGMDKEILDKIFEPFFTTKDVDKGTGLGLSMIYGIVKQNNGFINVYSESGKGTTIKIYLPQHEGKILEIQKESIAKLPQGSGETILLVEDDLAILNLTEKILISLCYEVLATDACKGAIKLAQEHTGKIHLLITDVIMPEMNGRELSEQLQSLFPDLKCIFMSGYTANTIAHQGVLDEGMHFVQKPFSKKDLATIIRKVLDEE